MNSNIIDSISKNTLFRDIPKSQVSNLLESCDYTLEKLPTEYLLLSERESCTSIGFIVSGQINVYKSNSSGNDVLVRSIFSGGQYGEAMVFSSAHECPSTLMTASETELVLINSGDILKLCELDPRFLKNMLETLSDKVLILNEKIKILSYTSVRQRLAAFILEEYKLKKSLRFNLQKTRQEIGDLLGITRPSISRELSNMANDNLISIDGKTIFILDLDRLIELL